MATNDPLDGKTRFARMLLTDWAWKQLPPLTSASDIAEALGLNRVTVWQWMNKQRTPTMAMVLIVAQRTGLPMDALMRAAGYEPPPSSDDVTARRVFEDLIDSAKHDVRMTEEERAWFIRQIRERQATYQTNNPNQEAASPITM
jgi:transcriptional regulator with XRE-family HTH domain